MAGFTILEHPADLGIEAYGATLKEAFEQAAVGLMSVILDLSNVGIREACSIAISAGDSGQLLVKWLTEVLYLYDGKKFAGCRFEIIELEATSLKAIVHGEPFDPAKHPTKLDVKAVTYHQLEVREEQGLVRVFLDI